MTKSIYKKHNVIQLKPHWWFPPNVKRKDLGHQEAMGVTMSLDVKSYWEKIRKKVRMGDQRTSVNVKAVLERMEQDVGPRWYQELSPQQMEAADHLICELRDDWYEDQTYRTTNALTQLGVCPTARRSAVRKAICRSHRQPVEFLLEMFKSFRGRDPLVLQKDYTINERLMLSAIAHLCLYQTLRELDRRLPVGLEPLKPPEERLSCLMQKVSLQTKRSAVISVKPQDDPILQRNPCAKYREYLEVPSWPKIPKSVFYRPFSLKQPSLAPYDKPRCPGLKDHRPSLGHKKRRPGDCLCYEKKRAGKDEAGESDQEEDRGRGKKGGGGRGDGKGGRKGGRGGGGGGGRRGRRGRRGGRRDRKRYSTDSDSSAVRGRLYRDSVMYRVGTGSSYKSGRKSGPDAAAVAAMQEVRKADTARREYDRAAKGWSRGKPGPRRRGGPPGAGGHRRLKWGEKHKRGMDETGQEPEITQSGDHGGESAAEDGGREPSGDYGGTPSAHSRASSKAPSVYSGTSGVRGHASSASARGGRGAADQRPSSAMSDRQKRRQEGAETAMGKTRSSQKRPAGAAAQDRLQSAISYQRPSSGFGDRERTTTGGDLSETPSLKRPLSAKSSAYSKPSKEKVVSVAADQWQVTAVSDRAGTSGGMGKTPSSQRRPVSAKSSAYGKPSKDRMASAAADQRLVSAVSDRGATGSAVGKTPSSQRRPLSATPSAYSKTKVRMGSAAADQRPSSAVSDRGATGSAISKTASSQRRPVSAKSSAYSKTSRPGSVVSDSAGTTGDMGKTTSSQKRPVSAKSSAYSKTSRPGSVVSDRASTSGDMGKTPSSQRRPVSAKSSAYSKTSRPGSVVSDRVGTGGDMGKTPSGQRRPLSAKSSVSGKPSKDRMGTAGSAVSDRGSTGFSVGKTPSSQRRPVSAKPSDYGKTSMDRLESAGGLRKTSSARKSSITRRPSEQEKAAREQLESSGSGPRQREGGDMVPETATAAPGIERVPSKRGGKGAVMDQEKDRASPRSDRKVSLAKSETRSTGTAARARDLAKPGGRGRRESGSSARSGRRISAGTPGAYPTAVGTASGRSGRSATSGMPGAYPSGASIGAARGKTVRRESATSGRSGISKTSGLSGTSGIKSAASARSGRGTAAGMPGAYPSGASIATAKGKAGRRESAASGKSGISKTSGLSGRGTTPSIPGAYPSGASIATSRGKAGRRESAASGRSGISKTSGLSGIAAKKAGAKGRRESAASARSGRGATASIPESYPSGASIATAGSKADKKAREVSGPAKVGKRASPQPAGAGRKDERRGDEAAKLGRGSPTMQTPATGDKLGLAKVASPTKTTDADKRAAPPAAGEGPDATKKGKPEEKTAKASEKASLLLKPSALSAVSEGVLSLKDPKRLPGKAGAEGDGMGDIIAYTAPNVAAVSAASVRSGKSGVPKEKKDKGAKITKGSKGAAAGKMKGSSSKASAAEGRITAPSSSYDSTGRRTGIPGKRSVESRDSRRMEGIPGARTGIPSGGGALVSRGTSAAPLTATSRSGARINIGDAPKKAGVPKKPSAALDKAKKKRERKEKGIYESSTEDDDTSDEEEGDEGGDGKGKKRGGGGGGGPPGGGAGPKGPRGGGSAGGQRPRGPRSTGAWRHRRVLEQDSSRSYIDYKMKSTGSDRQGIAAEYEITGLVKSKAGVSLKIRGLEESHYGVRGEIVMVNGRPVPMLMGQGSNMSHAMYNSSRFESASFQDHSQQNMSSFDSLRYRLQSCVAYSPGTSSDHEPRGYDGLFSGSDYTGPLIKYIQPDLRRVRRQRDGAVSASTTSGGTRRGGKGKGKGYPLVRKTSSRGRFGKGPKRIWNSVDKMIGSARKAHDRSKEYDEADRKMDAALVAEELAWKREHWGFGDLDAALRDQQVYEVMCRDCGGTGVDKLQLQYGFESVMDLCGGSSWPQEDREKIKRIIDTRDSIKLSRNRKKQEEILKMLFAAMVSDGLALPRLPQAHTIPYIRYFMAMRCGFRMTQKIKDSMLKRDMMSVDTLCMRLFKMDVPDERDIAPGCTADFNWDAKNKLKKISDKVQTRVRHELRRRIVDRVRLVWPTCRNICVPTSHCHRTYFALLGGREYDWLAVRPWTQGEYRDVKRIDKPCPCVPWAST